MIKQMLQNVKEKAPLIHNITNYVTVNDCANILLASGASPIMADDIIEVEEITSICTALNINIGTLNERTIASMLKAGKKSNELSHPVAIDLVGAGASTLRKNCCDKLLSEVKFNLIKGNASEIKVIATDSLGGRGVDASASDSEGIEKLAKAVAEKYDCVVAVTGAIDIITDKNTTYKVSNGHPAMSRITGTGCMLSALSTAFIAANDNTLLATVAAVTMMGIAGEIAAETSNGSGSFRVALIDAINNMKPEELEKNGKYEKIN